jgi:hypothetical protein
MNPAKFLGGKYLIKIPDLKLRPARRQESSSFTDRKRDAVSVPRSGSIAQSFKSACAARGLQMAVEIRCLEKDRRARKGK